MERMFFSMLNQAVGEIRATQELDNWKGRLLGALDEIRSRGSIATFNKYRSFPKPGLKIQGNAIYPYPLTEQVVQTIKSFCHRAPGDDSLPDNVWRFDATQFELTGPAWPEFLQMVVDDVEETLDVFRMSLKLKHLTLYGPGPIPTHWSLKRSREVYGTLTINLPSEHQGADDVTLSARKSSLGFSTSTPAVSVISWLHDVMCNVDDLVSGYRLAITYEMCRVDKYDRAPNLAEETESIMIRIQDILKDWSLHFPRVDKLLYPLADESNQRPQSLEETKGRDRAVCQFLNDACPKAGCYFLLARVTHEITEDRGTVTEVIHRIDSITTPLGLELPGWGEFDPQKDILGFSQSNLEHREADSDEGGSDEDEDEWESDYGAASTRRYHDTAVLIVPWERILSLSEDDIRAHDSDSTTFYGLHVENLVRMITTEMERFPDDPRTRQVVLDIMTILSQNDAVLDAPAAERLIELSLMSGDKELYDKTIAVVSFAAKSDSTNTAKLLEQYLTKEYLDKGEAVNWNDWLGPLIERDFKYSRRDCDYLKLSIENETLSQSFDAWAMDALDLKMATELIWDSQDCSQVLDWIKERSEKQDWILNKFLPNIAAHADRKYLLNLLSSLREQNGTPGFLNATAMRRSVMQHGLKTLMVRVQDFGYDGKSSDAIISPFLWCIYGCHSDGLPEEASRLLAATCADLAKSRDSWPERVGRSRAILEDFASRLAEQFGRGSAVPVPEFGQLVELLIRDMLPPFPVKRNDYTYDARGCSCADCKDLDKFLTSPSEWVWHFAPGKGRRKHIREVLSDTYSFRLEAPGNTLIVTKTGGEYQVKVKKWHETYRRVDRLLEPFRNEAMRGCLGDEKYRELILLEGYAQHVAPPGGGAGVRRSAASTLDEPESQRRRMI